MQIKQCYCTANKGVFISSALEPWNSKASGYKCSQWNKGRILQLNWSIHRGYWLFLIQDGSIVSPGTCFQMTFTHWLQIGLNHSGVSHAQAWVEHFITETGQSDHERRNPRFNCTRGKGCIKPLVSPAGAVWSLINVLNWCHSSLRRLRRNVEWNKTVGVELERSELTRPVSVAAPHHYCRFLLSCCCLSRIVGNIGTTFLQQRKATIARMVIVRPSLVLWVQHRLSAGL